MLHGFHLPASQARRGWEVRPKLLRQRKRRSRRGASWIQAFVGCGSIRGGLIEIVELARMTNPSGRRRYDTEAILAKLRQGEGIVCASGNGGTTRSSDLHEWRNDLGAVSSRDPVKL